MLACSELCQNEWLMESSCALKIGQLRVQGAPTKASWVWEVIVVQAYLRVGKVSEIKCLHIKLNGPCKRDKSK